MNKFTACDATTGEVLWKGDTFGPLVPQDNIAFYLDDLAPDLHYRGVAGWVRIPDKPSEVHSFDWSIHEWVDARSLADAKAAKWLDIVKARNAAMVERELVTPHGVFLADERGARYFRDLAFGLNELAKYGPVPDTPMSNIDNSMVVMLTQNQVTEIVLFLLVRDTQAQSRSRDRWDALQACTNLQQVDAITW